MGVSSSESHDLTAFYEMLTVSFGVLSQNTGFYPSLDRIVETTLGPLNLGPGGGSYNELISHLHRPCHSSTQGSLAHHQPQRPSFQLVGAPIKVPTTPSHLPLALHACMHAHSKSGHISTFGCVCLSLPAILEDFFITNQP